MYEYTKCSQHKCQCIMFGDSGHCFLSFWSSASRNVHVHIHKSTVWGVPNEYSGAMLKSHCLVFFLHGLWHSFFSETTPNSAAVFTAVLPVEKLVWDVDPDQSWAGRELQTWPGPPYSLWGRCWVCWRFRTRSWVLVASLWECGRQTYPEWTQYPEPHKLREIKTVV